jgi:hypothetical protein
MQKMFKEKSLDAMRVRNVIDVIVANLARSVCTLHGNKSIKQLYPLMLGKVKQKSKEYKGNDAPKRQAVNLKKVFVNFLFSMLSFHNIYN